MTKAGLWGTRFIADILAPFAPSGRDKPRPTRLGCAGFQTGALPAYTLGRLWAFPKAS